MDGSNVGSIDRSMDRSVERLICTQGHAAVATLSLLGFVVVVLVGVLVLILMRVLILVLVVAIFKVMLRWPLWLCLVSAIWHM